MTEVPKQHTKAKDAPTRTFLAVAILLPYIRDIRDIRVGTSVFVSRKATASCVP